MSDEQADRGRLLSGHTLESFNDSFGPLEIHVYDDAGDFQPEAYRLILHVGDDDGAGDGKTVTEALRNAIDDLYAPEAGPE